MGTLLTLSSFLMSLAASAAVSELIALPEDVLSTHIAPFLSLFDKYQVLMQHVDFRPLLRKVSHISRLHSFEHPESDFWEFNELEIRAAFTPPYHAIVHGSDEATYFASNARAIDDLVGLVAHSPMTLLADYPSELGRDIVYRFTETLQVYIRGIQDPGTPCWKYLPPYYRETYSTHFTP